MTTKTVELTASSFKHDTPKLIKQIGPERLLENLRQMLVIRHLETRGEAAYRQGKIGGFYHAYTGQEAVQTAMLEAVGPNNWWAISYRCHALALLLGVTPNELFAELYGREPGNAKGRGGSMHLYTDRLLGGSGIVGGQTPLAVGAAFAIKYKKIKDEVAYCFLGDGAVAQGAFHESLNLAALWDLPCVFVIENNHWGMGTAVDRAISVKRIAEEKAPGYGLKGYTADGMDYFNCYEAFSTLHKQVLKEKRPVLLEVVTERFRGHSISDPGLYRSKDELATAKQRDPIALLRVTLQEAGIIDDKAYEEMDAKAKEEILAAMAYADECPWPDPTTLEEGVFAPEEER